jgi:hypothetical protein
VLSVLEAEGSLFQNATIVAPSDLRRHVLSLSVAAAHLAQGHARSSRRAI